MPVLFGFANFLVPLMIGRAGHGVSAAECVQFLADGFGQDSLSISVLLVEAASTARETHAPRRAEWWAYAPLTPSRAFSPGHKYRTTGLSRCSSPRLPAASGPPSTSLPQSFVCRCPGMTLGRMPLLAWLNLVMSGMVLLAITPLSAAQLMLMVDRYLGGHFLRYAGGGIRYAMDAFLLRYFGHPRSVRTDQFLCFAFGVWKSFRVIFASSYLWLSP